MDARSPPPPIPPDRLYAGSAWHELWHLAHEAMGPWHRRPAPYLIDSFVDPDTSDRLWLRHRFAALAMTTRLREHDDEQADGALRWFVRMTHPDGSKGVVRVLYDPARDWIFNAFPDRGRTP